MKALLTHAGCAPNPQENLFMASSSSRRDFLRNAAISSGALVAGASAANAAMETPTTTRRPNILMICADQFRTDFIGANRENPSVKTPNLDALVQRGTNFRTAVCNQPLCSPSRASFLTGVTATKAKVWKLGLEMNHAIPTVATTLKAQGYTTAFFGKWHVAATKEEADNGTPIGGAHEKHKGGFNPALGLVPAGPARGGFDDVFEGQNVTETVSHPTGGHYWDTAGNDIGFKDIYRVDFVAKRAAEFISKQHDKPWLAFVSQLEPHQQNDVDYMVPPDRYADTYKDPYVPMDLRNLPGNWQTHMPGYYGCVQAIDDCVGTLVKALEKSGQLDNTVIVFFSDHGCTFRTRLGEYKRSPHDASLRVPLIFAGPGFDKGAVVSEVVSLIDLTPTLIDSAGASVPANMQGKSLLPLVDQPAARKAWRSAAYVQISSSICGRALRTKDWMYCCYAPDVKKGDAESSNSYTDFALYSLAGDPYEQVNLVGREEYRHICTELRDELKKRIVENGEMEPTITPVLVYA
jgi:arylsulfatase A-like enzyme